VCGQMILFLMVRGGNTVRVRGQFMKFGSSLMRVVACFSDPRWSVQFRTTGLFSLYNSEQSS